MCLTFCLNDYFERSYVAVKAGAVRILSVIFCITIIFTAVCLTRVELHGANPAALLFYNDRVWTQNSGLPAEEMHSVYYAPISLFVQLPSVDVRMNNTLHTFIITYGDKYLSFDISTNFAANQDKERMYLKTMEFHGERYVPIEAVCQSLGLAFETYTDPTTSSVAIRIADGSQKQSLESLAKSKYPGYFPETSAKVTESTTTKPDTTEKDTTEKDTTPVLSDRIIYITIDAAPGAYTNEILSVLREYDCRATFFILGDAAKNNASAVSAIAAGGHAIALHATSLNAAQLTSADAILADIEEQNALLELIIKQKSHIRRAPDNLSDKTAELLLTQGYILWGADVTVSPSFSVSRGANLAINGIWNNEVCVLRFTESKNTAQTLERVLQFISRNKNSCEVRILSTALDS